MQKTTTHPIRALTLATGKTEARRLAAAAGLTQKAAVELWKTARDKRSARKAASKGSSFSPVPVQDRWRNRKVSEAYRRAGYRSASHSHDWGWSVSDSPGASSDSGRVFSSDAGMSKAYCKAAYFVATSNHWLSVSRTWLRDVQARGLAVIDGLMTLGCSRVPALDVRADGRAFAAVWARQGRGTSLVTERGWLVQTDRSWTHAGSVRAARSVGGSVPQVASWTGDFAECLAANPKVTFRDARAAGLCAAGIRDWAERHNAGSLRPIHASALWALAQRADDRVSLVERAIRQAMGRLVATMARAA